MLLIALQFALPSRTVLPEDSGLAPRRARNPVVEPLPSYPALDQQDVFSLDRGAADAAPAGLDDYQAVGVIMTNRGAVALIKAAGASAELIRAGQDVSGWRLVDVGRQTLVFQQGRQRRSLAVGAPPLSVATAPPAADATAQTGETAQ